MPLRIARLGSEPVVLFGFASSTGGVPGGRSERRVVFRGHLRHAHEEVPEVCERVDPAAAAGFDDG